MTTMAIMQNMDNKPTLKEISLMAGVSIATVSRATRNPEKVKYSTRKRIEKAIVDLQVHSGEKRSGLIGLVVPDIKNQFFPMMLIGIDSVAALNDNTIILCNSDGNPDKETEIIKKLIDINIDGIIVIPSSKVSTMVREIIHNKIIPIIFLDRDPGVDSVGLIATENIDGMYQATKYLLSLGHESILYLGGKKDVSTDNDRLSGYMKAMHEFFPNHETSEIHGDFSFSSAYSKIKELIEEKTFDYTAIACANDVMALGAIKALNEAGFKIPDDISVIGYDDIPSAEFSGLTTVRQPFVEMGRTAMNQLELLIKDPNSKQKKIIMPTSIVLRNSCYICADLKRP